MMNKAELEFFPISEFEDRCPYADNKAVTALLTYTDFNGNVVTTPAVRKKTADIVRDIRFRWYIITNFKNTRDFPWAEIEDHKILGFALIPQIDFKEPYKFGLSRTLDYFDDIYNRVGRYDDEVVFKDSKGVVRNSFTFAASSHGETNVITAVAQRSSTNSLSFLVEVENFDPDKITWVPPRHQHVSSRYALFYRDKLLECEELGVSGSKLFSIGYNQDGDNSFYRSWL